MVKSSPGVTPKLRFRPNLDLKSGFDGKSKKADRGSGTAVSKIDTGPSIFVFNPNMAPF